ncbi:epidermal retinol dehydrogenase 2 [Galendromus occidentalis]|uniref:Short-chain dehydrogenase/reductase 3 n=1 Tax=Galendromus occidentalis TaxID=34638 RepID=A0AAJ6VZJ7_9ACAR|nr:epidermal retinol dehydrogenase 2 [Galendromus occidentalis]
MTSTTTASFVPQPVKGPPDDQNIFQAFARLVTNIVMVFYFILEAFVLKFVPSKLRFKNIQDEIVLVTGAGSGIGRLMATKFADLGAKVVCWDISKDGMEETVNDIKNKGGIAFSFVCNVADRQTVYAVADKVRDEVGKVSIIVNNAGIVYGKRLLELQDEQIEKSFAVNCLAHYWIVKAFLPDMQSSNHGHIVSIASLAGQTGVNRLTDYCGTKFAAVGFAESLALELYQEGYTGIRSTVVCPYFIDTGMFHGVNGGAFAFLSPDYVASEVVKGVLLNKDVVILPPHLVPLVALKHWFPASALAFFARETGVLHSMDSFNPALRNKKLN